MDQAIQCVSSTAYLLSVEPAALLHLAWENEFEIVDA